MPTSFKSVAFLVVLIAAVGAGWLLLRDRGSEPSDPAEPIPSTVEDGDAPRPDPEPVSSPAEEVDVAPPRVEPPPVEPPASKPPEEAPPAYLYPEQLALDIARWEDVPVIDILRDVARQARLELVIPEHIVRKLEEKRVTLDLQNTTGAKVIAIVLQRYELNYTMRGGAVHVITDDD